MKVGKWTVIQFISIIIPENQKAEIDFKIYNWKITAIIEFVNNEKIQQMTIVPDKPNPRIIFENWNSHLGITLPDPIEFGTFRGKKVYMLPATYKIGTTIKLDIQMMVGE